MGMGSFLKKALGGDATPPKAEEFKSELSMFASRNASVEDACLEPQAPTLFVVDRSGSMSPYLPDVNHCLERLRSTITGEAMLASRVRLYMSVFGGSIRVVQPFVSALRLGKLHVATASGGTPLYGAVIQALDDAEREKAAFRARGIDTYRSQIFLVTDGASSGEAPVVKAEALRRMHEAAARRAHRGASLHAIALGPHAENAPLEELAGKPPICVDENDIAALFDWVIQSMTRVACSQVGEEVELRPFDGE